MSFKYNSRKDGQRWTVVYGVYEGVEKFALNELMLSVQTYLPYCVEVIPAANKEVTSEESLILIGTSRNNKFIAELAEQKHVTLPEKRQGFTISCIDSPWKSINRVIVIAGYDALGVLYGTEELNVGLKSEMPEPAESSEQELEKSFDAMNNFCRSEYPLIENRGIWTWGNTIYDYKRFFDNMARLKMNMITIWLDCPPVNIQDVIDYAHDRGIKVVIGYSWGWGTAHELDSEEGIQEIKKSAVEHYEKNYLHLNIDGIYFQTKTEHPNTEMKGKSLASIVCRMVNETVAGIYEINPAIDIQFGLHANSIYENYMDLKELDDRITITWEDAGTVPYSYGPESARDPEIFPKGMEKILTFEDTLAYSKKIATFRPDTAFAMVPKGWVCTGGGYHRSFLLGTQHEVSMKNYREKAMADVDKHFAMWQKSLPEGLRFYSEIIDLNLKSITVTGLIEHGYFEYYIHPSYAMFAEMIWNPKQTSHEILEKSQTLTKILNKEV